MNKFTIITSIPILFYWFNVITKYVLSFYWNSPIGACKMRFAPGKSPKRPQISSKKYPNPPCLKWTIYKSIKITKASTISGLLESSCTVWPISDVLSKTMAVFLLNNSKNIIKRNKTSKYKIPVSWLPWSKKCSVFTNSKPGPKSRPFSSQNANELNAIFCQSDIYLSKITKSWTTWLRSTNLLGGACITLLTFFGMKTRP